MYFKKRDSLAGFVYDPEQEIFTTATDAWQRKFGYCRAYDEGAPFFNMIIDCEPFKFAYGGENWMIELWKGQYGMATGAEIGVYYSKNASGFYKCVKDADMLNMSLQLIKNKRERFFISARHWWLTGFALGEYSELSELRAVYCIEFPNGEMKSAFLAAAEDLGYNNKNVEADGLTVCVDYGVPLSKQPVTRTAEQIKTVGEVNKGLCEIWDDLTREADTLPKKLELAKRADPDLYRKITGFAKSRFTKEWGLL